MTEYRPLPDNNESYTAQCKYFIHNHKINPEIYLKKLEPTTVCKPRLKDYSISKSLLINFLSINNCSCNL